MTPEGRLDVEDADLLRRLPASLRDRIDAVDGHWVWAGSWIAGMPVVNGVQVKAQIFSQLVYEISALEMLARTCNNRWCVHPHHLAVRPKGRRGFHGVAK